MLGHMENQFLRANQNAATISTLHQGIQRCQLMVQTPPQKANPKDERRAKGAQRLVKIRGLLFADGEKPLFGNLRLALLRNRIKISDYSLWHPPLCKRKACATVRSHQYWCQRE